MGNADHKVPFRSEKWLADLASKIRLLARPTGKYTIDIVDLIARVLVERLSNTVGLTIVFFDGDILDDPAFVTFRKQYPQIILNVRRKVWEDAKKGLSYAYFVLAHEVAHILCHDHKAVAFTRDPSLRIQFSVAETSAEWQADTFAKHLAMPDQVLSETTDPYQLSIRCNVDISVAEERVRSYRRTGAMCAPQYEGEACGECGNFTLVRNGTCMKCNTCGSTTGCS